jgi:hypothetical protein
MTGPVAASARSPEQRDLVLFLFRAAHPSLRCDLRTKINRARFRTISRSNHRTPAGINTREMAAFRACLGLRSPPAAGAVDRARSIRYDSARLGAPRPYPPSPGPVHGVRANRSLADAVFLLVLVFIWAMPTHYAGRLLLDTDRRFRLSLVRTPDLLGK